MNAHLNMFNLIETVNCYLILNVNIIPEFIKSGLMNWKGVCLDCLRDLGADMKTID